MFGHSAKTKVLPALVCIITNLEGFAQEEGINKSLMVISECSWHSTAYCQKTLNSVNENPFPTFTCGEMTPVSLHKIFFVLISTLKYSLQDFTGL